MQYGGSDMEPGSFQELLNSERMQNARNKLTLAIGKDESGEVVACDLMTTGPILIAGEEGYGITECLNAMICSVLYRTNSDETKLILVDIKNEKLQIYNNSSHLLVPVITDPNKALKILAWAAEEMNERFSLFARHCVCQLKQYNDSLKEKEKRKPEIVIIINGIEDLVSLNTEEINRCLIPLVRFAKPTVGLHLIIVTHHPSLDNLPVPIRVCCGCCIAFKTSSSETSMMIVDHYGAEKLSGKGDMLLSVYPEFSPRLVRCCTITDDEISKMTMSDQV